MSKVRRKPARGAHRAAARKDASAGMLSEKKQVLLICLLLLVVTLAVYVPVFRNSFINYDDDIYVYRNSFVKSGLTKQSLAWAFNVGYAGNWHPLTWISHMLDYQLFGNNPGGHHATSLILHLANTILLFLMLRRMTSRLGSMQASRPGSMQAGSSWKSAFIAGLFALHPLHVESVAWVAERKDVLSAVFWMLAMGAYVIYSERPSIGRYLAVVLLFGLGLMAKPMLVSLPIILLLLDFWPLGRTQKVSLLRLVLEKVPLLAMSVGSGIITFIAQHKEGSVISLEELSPGGRVANALAAYVGYIWKTVFPWNLAVFYLHPGNSLPIRQVVLSTVFLAGITVLAIYYGRKRRYLAVGWLWFIITLVPVIGLVQVGRQAMADRYTYIPLIGLFIIAAMGVSDLVRKKGMALPVLAVAVVIPLVILTSIQVGYWRDSRTLFKHAVEVTRNNYLAHINLGMAFEEEKQYDEAINHYRQSLRIKSRNDLAHFSLGGALMDQGRLDESADEFRKAIAIEPKFALAYYNLGLVSDLQGKSEPAMREYRKALSIRSDMAPPHNNLGVSLAKQGKLTEAIEHFRRALEIEPDHTMAHLNLGMALYRQGKVNEAISEYRKSIASDPDHPNAYYNLGKVLEDQGKRDEAIAEYRNAFEVDSSFGPAATALQRLGEH